MIDATTTRSELINQHSIDLNTASSQIYGRLFVFGGQQFNDRDWFVNQQKIKEIAARAVRYKYFDIVYIAKRQRGTYFKDLSKSLVKLKTIPKNRWLGKMRNKILEQTLAGLREENGQDINSEEAKLFPYDILRNVEEMEVEKDDDEEEEDIEDRQSPKKSSFAAAIAAGSPMASEGEQQGKEYQQQQQQQFSQKIVIENNSSTGSFSSVAKQNEIMGQLVFQIMSGNMSVKELLQQNTSNIDALQVIAQHYDKFLKLEKNF